ncbi:MAG: peptidylprolyl isomerase [Planctomycetaceae bacterium]|nr:peptidylprolyl isomerase [Planctomycetaceae bacterium]
MVLNIHRIQQAVLLAVLLGLLPVGCQLRKPKDVVPVVGPPPPRYSYNNDAPSTLPLDSYAEELTSPQNETSLVSADLNKSNNPFKDTKTVAYVNGEPILASEILEPYLEKLEELKQKAPPEQFQQLKLGLIERDLPIQIDNRLLIQGFKSTLKKQQQETLDRVITSLFEEEILKLKQQFEVNTDHELEVELHKKNSSLASLERAFGNRVMAAEFLKSKAGSIPKPTRQDLLAEYNKRKQDEFYRPARVRWQQVLISYGENGGKQGAIQKLTQAANDLKRGVDFAEIAKEYSDGPGAEKGGYWDWMQRGSLTDQALEEALFSIPVGQISDVFVSETGVQLVRVLEREREHYIPFEDVQEALKDEMTKTFQEEASDRVIKELREEAVIQTIFDNPRPNITQARSESRQQREPSVSPITPIAYDESNPNNNIDPQTSVVEESPFFDDSPVWARPNNTATRSTQTDNPFQPLTSGNPFE